MSSLSERKSFFEPYSHASSLIITMILSWLLVGNLLGEVVAAREETPFLGQTNGFSQTWDSRRAAEVLKQLRHNSREKDNIELSNLLQRVRIVVPDSSLKEGFPNAYAFENERKLWVVIEEPWIRQVGEFAELGALFAMRAFGHDYASFVNNIYSKFCHQYQDTYRKAVRKNLQSIVFYEFSFEEFFPRSDPKFAVDYLLFDKLSALVVLNTTVWAVLHEIAHHALGHTTIGAVSLHTSRQKELDADEWAFSRMEELDYSLFVGSSYMVAQAMTENCFDELGLIGSEKDDDHPSWRSRDIALRRKFNVLAAPDQEKRIFYTPAGVPEPVRMSVVIPDSESNEFEAFINQSGNMTIGIAEWDGKTVRVYAREEKDGRIEYIVEDATKKLQLLEQRIYDRNNLLVSTVKLPSVQQDFVAFDFLSINGSKWADIRKRNSGGYKLFVIHLRRHGVSESEIRRVLAVSRQHNEKRRGFMLQYMKGNLSDLRVSEQKIKEAHEYKQLLIGIIGQERYHSVINSISDELKRTSPPMAGSDIWWEKIMKDNIEK